MLVAGWLLICLVTLLIFPHTAVGTIPRAETRRASFVNVEPHGGRATQTIRKIHVRAKHGVGWLLGQSRKSSTTWHSETQIPSIAVGATPRAHLTALSPRLFFRPSAMCAQDDASPLSFLFQAPLPSCAQKIVNGVHCSTILHAQQGDVHLL